MQTRAVAGVEGVAGTFTQVYRVLAATSTSVGLLIALRLMLGNVSGYATFVTIPLGVLAMDFVLSFLGVTGVRVLRRALVEAKHRRQRSEPKNGAIPTLLIGAGWAGVTVAKELSARRDLGILAVGFVDDDPMKVGEVVLGHRVYGTTAQLAEVREKTGAQEVLITIASATGKDIRPGNPVLHCLFTELNEYAFASVLDRRQPSDFPRQ